MYILHSKSDIFVKYRDKSLIIKVLSQHHAKCRIFAFLRARESLFQKNASFEEDFVSFLLIASRIFLPPLGGLEGGFIFAFLGAGEVLFSNSRF